jgi:ABC-2 type transport system ATP-binding protein
LIHERIMIRADGLSKSFGATKALDGIHVTIPEGAIVGVLGPNGAGKTTMIRILATLLKPDAGSATVGGIDVVREPEKVRKMIGLTGQSVALDPKLTGRENLEMLGRLNRLPSRESRTRAWRLVEEFDLREAANRPVKTYSGGMKRRLDLAAGLIADPPVLFLDEPTTGLDPEGRSAIWNIVRERVRQGTTVVLTTHYLDEADQLADTVVVVAKGRIVASGPAHELKARMSGMLFEVTVRTNEDLVRLRTLFAGRAATFDDSRRSAHFELSNSDQGLGALEGMVGLLKSAAIDVESCAMRSATLEETYLKLTEKGEMNE